ncbi:polyketide synthase [Aspergillus ellipticus CBS 707.79]|uniref:Polyketide synthase n=1 Tax=Aspergillus ellipticus CBS 707.79 TaxID=1448320 RepID=A0A319DL08_9EURO|nr:polyketide synthase [Aspergillus ellipticus CBS 707.79]
MAEDSATAPLAIVGMACRFSGGATSPEKLWEMIVERRSGWTEIPSARFDAAGLYHPNGERVGTTHVKGGHFLEEDIARFDASFFGMPAETASAMDPQYRMELEIVYEALESAGIPMESLRGTNTSVYGGVMFRDYHDTHSRDPDTLPRYFMTGNAATMASNRISHFYDLCGPSMSVDTGCSTTLTALHLACQNLRRGESDLAVVTGASLMITPDIFLSMSNIGFLSPDGISYAFDSRANGYGRGEGVAALLVKRLDDALRDGDPIRAVLRETGVNQNGKTPSITAPRQAAQEALIRQCYARVGLDPSQTGYVEAHGTGTPTGDPLEVGALAEALGRNRSSEQPLYLGSVKANIGHTEAASGLASIIKVALALEKGQIPPNTQLKTLNSQLRLGERNIEIPIAVKRWPAGKEPRRASVNNFGFGGSNAHAILEFPNGTNGTDGSNGTTGINGNAGPDKRDTPRVFRLSAKDAPAVQQMAADLREYLQSHPPTDEETFLDRLAHTLGSRRSLFPWSAAVSATSRSDLIEALADERRLAPSRGTSPLRLGWVFTGQGAQWFAMGRELIATYPVFRAAIEECDRYMAEMGSTWTLMEELHRAEATSQVNNIIALVQLLWAWGVRPTAVTGHSSGEIAAAYAAGALDVQSAIGIAYLRGVLAEKFDDKILGRGGMVAVGLGREAANAYIARVTAGYCVVACVNSQASVTVSGDIPALAELEAMLQADQVFARRLRVNGAFHCDQMLPMADLFDWSLRYLLKPQPDFGPVLFSSPKTGLRIDDGSILATSAHWVGNMLQPVEFESSFRHMCFAEPSPDRARATQDVDLVLEVGPHGALGGPMQQLMTLPEFADSEIAYLPTLLRGKDSVAAMQRLAVDLLHRGYPVDLKAVNFPHGLPHLSVLHDLPSYPWNHRLRYWLEPRLNRAYRHRRGPPSDLVGSLQPSITPLAHTWRLILRLSDLPWLGDHRVQSDIVFPGAGLVSMAIEGMRQVVGGDGSHRGCTFELRDVDIAKALTVPETAEGIEVQLTIRPCEEQMLGTKDWQAFQIVSVSVSGDNRWTAHCRGRISMVATDHSHPVPPRLARSSYHRRLDPGHMWAAMRAVGIYHGPLFQNIRAVEARRSESRTVFTVADTAAVMPKQHQTPAVVHPTTLDSVFQAAYTLLPEAGARQSSAMVPRHIRALRVSDQLSSRPGHELAAYGTLDRRDRQSFQTSLSVMDASGEGRPLIEVDGLACQSLGRALARPVHPHEAEVCSRWEWAPDIACRQPAGWMDHIRCAPDPAEIETMRDLRRATVTYIHAIVTRLTVADIARLPRHHKKYYVWMAEQLKAASRNELGPASAQWAEAEAADQAALFARVAAASVNGEMLCRLGPRVAAILRQEVPPLEVMLEERLLFRYYIEALKWNRAAHQVSALVQLCAHKTPQARILEIGAGTGGGTQIVLDALGKEGSATGARFGRYDFTDISAGFFEAAKERFQDWAERMTFQQLDIERDPAAQGFEGGSYDVVVACQVLHATTQMDRTLTHVRQLLKPGGKLILLETTRDELDVFFTFGLLPGWWLAEEDERRTTPSLSLPFWQQVLARNGLTGIDLEVHDCESDDFYEFSTILATAQPPPAPLTAPVSIVLGPSTPPAPWLSALHTVVAGVTGCPPSVESLDTIDPRGKICLFLGEAEQPMLDRVQAADFDRILRVATRCKGLLWVSRGGAMEADQPAMSLSQGLLRTLKTEYQGTPFVSLDVDPRRPPWTTDTTQAIARILQGSFDEATELATREVEYAERDGVLHIPRAVKDVPRNQMLAPNDTLETRPRPFLDARRPLRMAIGTPGLIDTLGFRDDPDAGTDLAPDWIEMAPTAFGLNFRDIMVAMGQLQANAVMGFECAGTIVRLGSAAAAQGFAVGDRVCSLLRGHWATRPRAPWTSVMRIPRHLSEAEAASLPTVLATAYIALHDTARLQPGESVLIHAATGGVGQAAILLAQLLGAEIYATASTPAKRQLLMATYGIPADHIFSSRDPSFATEIHARTAGQGVDVVLNSLAGRLLQESFNCLREFGRLVEIGKRDLEQHSGLDLFPFTRNVSFASVDLLTWQARRGPEVARVLAAVGQLLETRRIRPVHPLTVYPISAIEKAFRTMQAGQHMGKIVISVDPQDLVPVVERPPPFALRPDASYLIVGGLGGIGRALCEWMVAHGARHLVVMSRHARPGSFVAELETLGCQVRTLACDIAAEEDLAEALKQCSDMPPLRGVIQAAMVLKDTILEQMTVSDFEAAVRPKVQGSWNLHQQLGPVDFFVMLSSLVGVMGGTSQANYAAGGAFQDALAAYRRHRGLPAVSLDLGMVRSVGFVAQTEGVQERLGQLGVTSLAEETVLQIVQQAITQPDGPAQIITGINTGPGAHWDEAAWIQDPRFAALKYREMSQASTARAGSGTQGRLRDQLAAVASPTEAAPVICRALGQKLGSMFGLAEEEISATRDLTSYGVDSLVAVELRNWLVAQVGAEVSIFELMQSPSLEALADRVAARRG